MGKRAEAKARQKAWKIYESQIKPALEKGAQFYTPNVIDPVNDAKVKKLRQKFKARLVSPEMKKDADKALFNDTSAKAPPTGYYVIVGQGAAAVVNHTTLRQSVAGRARIGNHPVLHVGMRDPWLYYHQHGMGQPPYLLRLPGYHNPVALNAATIRTGLRSDLFAASTEAELDLLRDKFETYVVEGWVAALESRVTRVQVATRQALQNFGLDRGGIDARLDSAWPGNYPPYRLLVAGTTGQLFLLYAFMVDLCNGGGAGRTTPREAWTVPGPLLQAAATKPWNPSYLWANGEEGRPIIHGLDGLTEATTWATGTRVCVYGSGGIGLNQLERAHDEHHDLGRTIWVDWYGRDFLHDPTFNLRRNDTVLRDLAKPLANPFMDAGGADLIRTSATVFNTGFHIVPGSPLWRWAHHSKIRNVAQPGRLQLDLYLQADVGVVANLALQANPWCEDFWQQVEQGSPNRQFAFSAAYQFAHPVCVAGNGDEYDRLILCLGQQQDVPGEPRKVADGFAFTAILHDNRMVGLQAAAGDIRVLGAGAVMFPGVANIAGSVAMTTYRTSMAASAVPPGFILMGANVAAANGFFTQAQPNQNVNTISWSELIDLLETQIDPMLAIEVANEIVTLRSFPNNGIATMHDLDVALSAKWHNPDTVEGFIWVIDNLLSIDYRAPDVWP